MPETIDLTPEARAIGVPRGTEIELSDGRSWTLADFPATWTDVWDALFDDNVIRRRYKIHELQTAADRLLQANYRLTADEAIGLVSGVDPGLFVAPVERALFNQTNGGKRHATWTEYVQAALWSNGINPKEVPPNVLHRVLEMMQESGKIISEQDYISSLQYVAKRAGFLSGLKDA